MKRWIMLIVVLALCLWFYVTTPAPEGCGTVPGSADWCDK